MGVKGLLQALVDVQRETHVSHYRGLRLGIDGYCFLHRGKYACSWDLVEAARNGGRVPEILFKPLLELVLMVRNEDVEPLVVFDGGPLPAKRSTEVSRDDCRRSAQWKGATLLRYGEEMSSCRTSVSGVEITPAMAAQCAAKLRELGVICVVAPYEADAQLAHLSMSKRVDVVASSDGDLLAFGCNRVIFDLRPSGWGREICLGDIHLSRGLAPYRFCAGSLPDLCVLSGCDYVASLPGVGVKKASQLLYQARGDLGRALTLAKRSGILVQEGHAEQLEIARLVYAAQVVFNVATGQLETLTPLPDCFPTPPAYLGRLLPEGVGRGIAEARLCPITLQPFDTELLSVCSTSREFGIMERGSTFAAASSDRRLPVVEVAPAPLVDASNDHVLSGPSDELSPVGRGAQEPLVTSARAGGRPCIAKSLLSTPVVNISMAANSTIVSSVDSGSALAVRCSVIDISSADMDLFVERMDGVDAKRDYHGRERKLDSLVLPSEVVTIPRRCLKQPASREFVKPRDVGTRSSSIGVEETLKTKMMEASTPAECDVLIRQVQALLERATSSPTSIPDLRVQPAFADGLFKVSAGVITERSEKRRRLGSRVM